MSSELPLAIHCPDCGAYLLVLAADAACDQCGCEFEIPHLPPATWGGAMTFDMNPADEDEHAICKQEIDRLKAELAIWKPLSPEEADAALAEVEAEGCDPLSEEQIERMVKQATDPTTRFTEPEHVRMLAEIRRRGNKIDRLRASRDALAAACQAVLLFHSAEAWDQRQRIEWYNLTQSNEATTKAMCNTIRAALATVEDAP
jgi:hypothetical protein